jgi:hypothetical protein
MRVIYKKYGTLSGLGQMYSATYISYQNINTISTPRKINDRAVVFHCLQFQEPENQVLAEYRMCLTTWLVTRSFAVYEVSATFIRI